MMGSVGIEAFQTTFAVPLHCDSCVQDVSKAVGKLDGISRVEANLQDQLVFIEGTAAPSSIVAAIETTGRDAILRGSGQSNTAGVCILETHAPVSDPVRGLARMVQVGKNVTLIDLTIKGLPAGSYHATVRETGDISQGGASTGAIWEGGTGSTATEEHGHLPRGSFGLVEVGQNGRGSVFLDRPFSIWEVIGRSMVISSSAKGPFQKNDPNTLVGVIARSAGVWDNGKAVCSCSGKNVWQERREQVEKGML